MTTVEFVKLKRPERARILCELAEEFHLAGERVVVRVADHNQGVTLDQFLWTWQKGSFVPHAYRSGSVECLDEPVVIVAEEENPNAAGVLLMGVPCSLDFIRRFRRVIDFAEAFDDERLAESRERFRSYREHGLKPVMRE